MAHRLLEEPIIETRKKTRTLLKLPAFEGKFGIALFIGGKEVFLGVAVADVQKEEVVKRRYIKPHQGTVRVFRMD